MAAHGPEVDTSQVYADDVLERELRDALKSEGEIELFKRINKALRVKGELADSETVRQMLADMWENVAEFFEAVTDAKTLAGLANDDELVLQHQLMRANFAVVANVNQLFKEASEAEVELTAVDQMARESEATG